MTSDDSERGDYADLTAQLRIRDPHRPSGSEALRTALDALTDEQSDPAVLRELLEAVLLVGQGLDLADALQRIVDVAAAVLDAQYCALGVRSPELRLQAFVYTGISPEVRAEMGGLPIGRGVLGELLQHPEVLRIAHLGEHPASVGFPPHHPPMDTFLGAPIIVRGELFGSIYLTEKQTGSEFTPQDEQIVSVLAVAAGIAVDNARMYERQRTRHRWMEILAHRGSEPMAGLALDDTLNGLCADVAALTGATDVFIVSMQGGQPCLHGHTGRPVEPADITWPGLTFSVSEASGAEWLRRGARWKTAQPMQQTPGDYGAIVLTHVDRPNWEPEEIAGLAGVARVASLAIAYAEQQQLTRELETLEDRHRIARDLHDHVIQRLFAIGMSLQTMLAAPNQVEERMAQVIVDLDATIAQIRTSIFDLQSSSLHGESVTLRRKVLDVVAELARHAPIVPSVSFAGPVDTLVPDRLAPHIEAVLREGLSNALRHSGAMRIGVRIVADDVLTVEISDDGCGIPTDVGYRGLDNLTRRADECDGNFTVDTAPGRGTVLIWEVPLD
ncbi:GAF domain-containing sensor histidine kinase [Gordonia sp. PP30]|uniref:GAF domain-containing sensor histidine kinase n=1 Tax=unclassified Gordonia (in: high G+C Gram-positive bacteria) TaxID=2657482 RepID=UPI001FFE33D8|nr:GAF domain-containing sensor histidine kinase [Gordonia sp. PP30]UQE73410.1 GAF domain-containing sensor histidine kinase [Gordonia sp. PP30]